MNRHFCILLILLFIISLCSCKQSKDSIQTPVSFYYCNSTVEYNAETAVISAEVRDSSDYVQDLKGLLNLYFQGPVSHAHQSPFPPGVQVSSLDEADGVIHIVLNAPFASLKGLDLTVACACLSKTVIGFTGCKSVEISVKDLTIVGSASITMDTQSLLLIDDSF